MSKLTRLAAGAVAGTLIAVAAQAQDSTTATADAATVLATVNGTEITLGHVIALTGRLPAQYRRLPDEVLYNGIVEQLIQQTALMQEIEPTMGREAELALENERRAFLASELIQRLSDEPIDEAALQAAYAEKYVGQETEEEANAAHILVETQAEAEEIAGLLEDGGDFAELARERSIGPSGPSGGELDWQTRGNLVAPFAEALFALEPGEVSAPVETEFGWHVILLHEKRMKAAPTLDDVRDDLEQEQRDKRLGASLAAITDAADVVRAEVEVDPAVIRDETLLED